MPTCTGEILTGRLQDVVALWEQRFQGKGTSVVVVGHSMGGSVAVRAAATKVHCQQLDCAVLLNCMALLKTHALHM